MTHAFLCSFATYMCNDARNITMVKFFQGKNLTSKRAVVISGKVSRTSTSNKDLYGGRSCNESDMFSTVFKTA